MKAKLFWPEENPIFWTTLIKAVEAEMVVPPPSFIFVKYPFPLSVNWERERIE